MSKASWKLLTKQNVLRNKWLQIRGTICTKRSLRRFIGGKSVAAFFLLVFRETHRKTRLKSFRGTTPKNKPYDESARHVAMNVIRLVLNTRIFDTPRRATFAPCRRAYLYTLRAYIFCVPFARAQSLSLLLIY